MRGREGERLLKKEQMAKLSWKEEILSVVVRLLKQSKWLTILRRRRFCMWVIAEEGHWMLKGNG